MAVISQLISLVNSVEIMELEKCDPVDDTCGWNLFGKIYITSLYSILEDPSVKQVWSFFQ